MRLYLILITAVIVGGGFVHAQTPPPAHVPTQDDLLGAAIDMIVVECDEGGMKWFMGRHPNFDVNHVDTYTKISLLEASITRAKCPGYDQSFYRSILELPSLDINMKTTFGITPLDLSILRSNTTPAKLLLARSDSVFTNTVIPYSTLSESSWGDGQLYCTGCTILEFVAGTIFSDTLTLLLKSKKVDVNAGSLGSSPLIAAAGFGNLEAVILLLDAGAEVNKKNFQGFTALKAVRESARERVFCPVKFERTDPNILGELIYGDGPSVPEDTRKKIIRVLLDHGAQE